MNSSRDPSIHCAPVAAAPERFRRSRLRGALLVGWFVLLLAGCAHHRADTTVCAEYRSLRCLAGAVCSLDRRRGCRVCQCAAHQQDPQGSLDRVVPEDGTRPDPIQP